MLARWRKRKFMAVIAVVVVASISVIAASYYISTMAPLPEPTHTRYLTFRFRTFPQESGSYIVRLPLIVPSNATPTPDPVNEFILAHISGGQGEIVSTEHGYAFEIESDTSSEVQVILAMSVNSSVPLDYYKLSMCSGQCGESNRAFRYYAYLQSANVTDLFLDEELGITDSGASRYGGSASFACMGSLVGGWQLISGSYSASPAPIP
jgi:hypothetical protein